TEFLFQCAEFPEIFENALRFGFVNDADSEADVDENVFTDLGLGSVGEIDFLADAAEIDFTDAEGDVSAVGNFNDSAWNRETHERPPVPVAPDAFVRGGGRMRLPLRVLLKR